MDEPPRVLIVDDEPSILESWAEFLEDEFEVELYADPTSALAYAQRSDTEVDVALLDLRMPGMDGLTLMQALKALPHSPEVIMITGQGSIESAVQAMRMGAYDFLCKPIADFDDAICRIRAASERRRLRRLNASLKERLLAFAPDRELIGESIEIHRIRDMIPRLHDTSAPVLITGESGTGKELIARAIHASSSRTTRPFVAANCGAFADSLVDSELFGHERGAFTGAVSAHRGLFEAADGGVLFLDEIGDLPLDTQVRLLRALQEGEIRPVGSTRSRHVDVRIVAATNVDLERAMREGRFREDLYFRISTFRIHVPPLRERRDDIPLLAHHLLNKVAQRLERPALSFSDEVLEALVRYNWPGNVRELANTIEYGATLSTDGRIALHDLPTQVTAFERSRPNQTPEQPSDAELLATEYHAAKEQVVRAFEIRYLSELLRSTEGNLSAAARQSGIDRSNLRRMLRKHDIAPTPNSLA
ncbi:MAG: sigma-54-dependent Fis family transcriptional regulator [Deltaproteobacteria bacterium]|nr:sigma-54-dependent Fis family transcriptional regulator [Deltaproteobacteria bacterium]